MIDHGEVFQTFPRNLPLQHDLIGSCQELYPTGRELCRISRRQLDSEKFEGRDNQQQIVTGEKGC